MLGVVLGQEGVDAGTLLEAIPAMTLLGFSIACVRLAFTAHNRRAETAEAREQTCTSALAATVAATAALTAEVRDGDDALTQQLTPIRQGLDELLSHARRTQREGP